MAEIVINLQIPYSGTAVIYTDGNQIADVFGHILEGHWPDLISEVKKYGLSEDQLSPYKPFIYDSWIMNAEIPQMEYKPFEKEQTDIVWSKKGRSAFTDREKLNALVMWYSLNPYQDTRTLEEFLDTEFGSENGVLKVAKSTFYGWEDKLEYRKLWDKEKKKPKT